MFTKRYFKLFTIIIIITIVQTDSENLKEIERCILEQLKDIDP